MRVRVRVRVKAGSESKREEGVVEKNTRKIDWC